MCPRRLEELRDGLHPHSTEGKGEREGERRMERELFLAPDPAGPDLALSL